MELIGDLFLRVTGPVYFLFGMSLIFSVVWLLFTVILPKTRDGVSGAALSTFTAWVFFNTIFNYFMAARTNPGSPREQEVQVPYNLKKVHTPHVSRLANPPHSTDRFTL